MLDDNGQWKDIDNSLALATVRGEQVYTMDTQRTSFAHSVNTDQTVLTIEENGYRISMGLIENKQLTSQMFTSSVVALPVTAKVTNSSANRTAINIMSLEEVVRNQSSSTVLYENILPNIDLEYVLVNNDVKENIIVKAPSDSYSYYFALELEGLDAEMKEDGSISITDSISGEEKYEIPAPFMYDADNNYSGDVVYELTYLKGKYYLCVTAEAEWINADSRAFPITIDPSINTTSTVYDTYISSASPSTNFGSNTAMWVSDGDTESRHGESITFVRIPNLPSLPSGVDITATKLYMPYGFYTQDTSSGYVQVGAYRINKPWSETGVTWNVQKAFSNMGISSTLLDSKRAEAGYATQYNPGWLVFSLGDLGEQWYNGSYNYGIALKHIGGPNWSVMFRSSETSYKPYIVIQYGLPYTLTMEHYLDSGYRVRFDNAIDRVSIYESVVSDVLYNLYNLKVYSNIQAYQSAADSCKLKTYEYITSDHLAIPCTHAPTHLTTSALRRTLVSDKSAGSSTLSRYLWTGHILADNQRSNSASDSHTVVMTSAMVIDDSYENLSATDVRKESIFTLLHETSHQLGAPDHYCYGTNGDSQCSNDDCSTCNGQILPACIMSTRYNVEITNINQLYCDTCIATIKAHLETHH